VTVVATDTSKTRIVVEGVELVITQTKIKRNVYVKVSRKVGRDRTRQLDITGGIETKVEDALSLVRVLREAAKLQIARCTCDYRYGYSDHAEHCQSIYVASYDGACIDDD
jgi:hypothetical protein